MLPLTPPLEPMLARLERSLPQGSDLRYEPKWDGFRCLAFCDGADVRLHSRNDRPLTRYFPEVVRGLRRVPPAVLDGELMVCADGRADFPALLARLHPAASRVERLAGETPGCFVVFDLPALDAEDLTTQPFSVRRRRLEGLLDGAPQPITCTPQTDDRQRAERWLDAAPGSGIDGVVVKPLDLQYHPGRRAMTKVKRLRTADCVVAGLRVHPDGDVGSLLLGLRDRDVLHHVGVVGPLGKATRLELRDALRPLVTDLPGHPWEQGFGLEGGALGRLKGTAGRWTPDLPRDWVPLRPERVAEVSYDHVEGSRFRHPARFVRWRPDREPSSCTVEQLR